MFSWLRSLFGGPARGEGTLKKPPAAAPFEAKPAAPNPRFGARPGLKQKVDFIVGLDFGTSTSKVVLNARLAHGAEERQAIKIDGHACHPSTVVRLAGELHFGHASPAEPDAELIRSLKTHLRCGVPRCAYCQQHGADWAEFLAWTYLGYLAKRTREAIASLYPVDRFEHGRVLWNMGVPLDNRKERHVQDRFGAVMYRAVHFCDVEQGIEERGARAAFEAACKRMIPNVNERDCTVFPEAAVAANAFKVLHRALVDREHYFVCDVGAGTTDLAFFWYSQAAEKQISFYGTASARAGGDDFERILADHLRRPRAPGLLEREVGKVRSDVLKRIFAPILQDLSKTRRRGFGRSLQKERDPAYWREIQGLLIGGGAEVPHVRERLMRAMETGNGNATIPIFPLDIDPRTIPGATALHAIAVGLSLDPARIDDCDLPEDVAPRLTPAGELIREEWDDWYPE